MTTWQVVLYLRNETEPFVYQFQAEDAYHALEQFMSDSGLALENTQMIEVSETV